MDADDPDYLQDIARYPPEPDDDDDHHEPDDPGPTHRPDGPEHQDEGHQHEPNDPGPQEDQEPAQRVQGIT